jgi:hypothetical protein
MPQQERPGQDPRKITFSSRTLGVDADIRINSPKMDSLSPAERDALQIIVGAFTATIFQAFDSPDMKKHGATPMDVFKHIGLRLGQVNASIEDGSIRQNPEDINNPSDFPLREYTQELADASINTHEGIEKAKERTIAYTMLAKALIDELQGLNEEPESKERNETIDGLGVTLKSLINRVEGLEEAVHLVLGREFEMPEQFRILTEIFRDESPDQQ